MLQMVTLVFWSMIDLRGFVCLQIITTDLNKVVVELLQSLLFWQERSKAMNAHNAARKKRLVSGLREVRPYPPSLSSSIPQYKIMKTCLRAGRNRF